MIISTFNLQSLNRDSTASLKEMELISMPGDNDGMTQISFGSLKSKNSKGKVRISYQEVRISGFWHELYELQFVMVYPVIKCKCFLVLNRSRFCHPAFRVAGSCLATQYTQSLEALAAAALRSPLQMWQQRF